MSVVTFRRFETRQVDVLKFECRSSNHEVRGGVGLISTFYETAERSKDKPDPDHRKTNSFMLPTKQTNQIKVSRASLVAQFRGRESSSSLSVCLVSVPAARRSPSTTRSS